MDKNVSSPINPLNADKNPTATAEPVSELETATNTASNPTKEKVDAENILDASGDLASDAEPAANTVMIPAATYAPATETDNDTNLDTVTAPAHAQDVIADLDTSAGFASPHHMDATTQQQGKELQEVLRMFKHDHPLVLECPAHPTAQKCLTGACCKEAKRESEAQSYQ